MSSSQKEKETLREDEIKTTIRWLLLALEIFVRIANGKCQEWKVNNANSSPNTIFQECECWSVTFLYGVSTSIDSMHQQTKGYIFSATTRETRRQSMTGHVEERGTLEIRVPNDRRKNRLYHRTSNKIRTTTMHLKRSRTFLYYESHQSWPPFEISFKMSQIIAL